MTLPTKEERIRRKKVMLNAGISVPNTDESWGPWWDELWKKAITHTKTNDYYGNPSPLNFLHKTWDNITGNTTYEAEPHPITGTLSATDESLGAEVKKILTKWKREGDPIRDIVLLAMPGGGTKGAITKIGKAVKFAKNHPKETAHIVGRALGTGLNDTTIGLGTETAERALFGKSIGDITSNYLLEHNPILDNDFYSGLAHNLWNMGANTARPEYFASSLLRSIKTPYGYKIGNHYYSRDKNVLSANFPVFKETKVGGGGKGLVPEEINPNNLTEGMAVNGTKYTPNPENLQKSIDNLEFGISGGRAESEYPLLEHLYKNSVLFLNRVTKTRNGEGLANFSTEMTGIEPTALDYILTNGLPGYHMIAYNSHNPMSVINPIHRSKLALGTFGAADRLGSFRKTYGGFDTEILKKRLVTNKVFSARDNSSILSDIDAYKAISNKAKWSDEDLAALEEISLRINRYFGNDTSYGSLGLRVSLTYNPKGVISARSAKGMDTKLYTNRFGNADIYVTDHSGKIIKSGMPDIMNVEALTLPNARGSNPLFNYGFKTNGTFMGGILPSVRIFGKNPRVPSITVTGYNLTPLLERKGGKLNKLRK